VSSFFEGLTVKCPQRGLTIPLPTP
jgi:hypothetical protein